MALRPQHVAQELLSKVTKALGITALDQWYHVSHHAATKAIGTRVLNDFGGTLIGFLKAAYPHHQFDETKLLAKKNHEKDQKFMEVIIRQLFPNTEIQMKARKAVGILNPETNAYLEIDFWIPSLKLGIEYQDKHHYEYQWYAHGALEDYQKRDDIKKATMPTLGYTLITIGCWWDRTPESVVATIRNARPDLLQDYGEVSAKPIPPDPPPEYVIESSAIPGVAGIMNPFIPRYNFNPTNWYAGEKHDGIRGVFNPNLNAMFSRAGKQLSVLPSLLKDIPNILVEGEITAGRGNYSRTAAVSYHSHHGKVDWPMFRYVLFDIPSAELGNYRHRYSLITKELSARPFIFAQPTFRVLVVNKAHLKMLVDSIIFDAGEGAIVQKDVQYESGRAKGLAKIKVRRDADAQVLGVNNLSCTCKLASGVTVEIPYSDGFEPRTLKVGDVVSYYHIGHSKSGKPKQGEIYKIRYDISWEQLTSEKVSNVRRKSVKDAIGARSLVTRNEPRNKLGHWNKASNVRTFFDEFARSSDFDPLVPENWYPVTYSSLLNAKGGALLHAYSFKLKKALSCAYPELKLEATKFRTRTVKNEMARGHWNNSSNVRAFFDEFAQKFSFNPLVPANWYQVTGTSVRNAGGGGLLKAYNSNLAKALSQAYPEVKLNRAEFRTRRKATREMKHGHWAKSLNVRAFFDNFARRSGFDPVVPDNWYPVKYSSLQNAGGRGLLNAYDYNLMAALSFAYPELKFQAKKLKIRDKTKGRNKMKYGHWNELPNVREFFNEFARTAGFDPLVPDNWYPVKTRALKQAGGSGLLNISSKMKALVTAYPELKFEAEKLQVRNKREESMKVKYGHWKDDKNVRAFFDEFARMNEFDPLVPENWYSITGTSLRNAKGSGLLYAHEFKLQKALKRAYPELKFEDKAFRSRADKGHWDKPQNVRAFFEGFASKAAFNPLIPENWKSVTHSTLLNSKVSGLLKAYRYNVTKALSYAYPELKNEIEQCRN